MFEDIENKEDEGEVKVKSNKHETNTHATTLDDINVLLEDEYKLNNYQKPDPDNKPIYRGNDDQPVYKCEW